MGLSFCQPHWKSWMQTIKDCGLDHLCSKDSMACAEKIQAEVKQEAPPEETFEPAITGMMLIFKTFIEDAGPNIIGIMTDEQCHCPLCIVDSGKPGMAEDWIQGCAGDMLKRARFLKLVPEVQ